MGKRLLITSLVALATLCMWAAGRGDSKLMEVNTAPRTAEFLTPNAPPASFDAEPVLQAKGASVATFSASTKRGVARPVADVLGKYFSSATSYYSGNRAHAEITISQRGDSVVVHNLFGAGTDVVGTYDAATGTLSLKPQLLFVHSTYGPAWIHTWNGKPSSYSATAAITAVAQADGQLLITTPWGIYVHEGASKGGVFDAYKSTELAKANARLAVTRFTGGDTAYDARVEQAADNEMTIINIDGHAHEVTTTLLADSSSRMGPQYIMTLPTFGDFNFYGATKAGKVSKFTYVTGKHSGDTMLTIGPWGIFCVKSTSIAYVTAKSTTLTVAGGITYPKAAKTNFEGAGTAESPYLIKTFDDLKTLSAAVNGGLATKGVNYALAADIDASVSSSASKFNPIGFDASSAFNGTFDGAGHTVSNFSLDGLGDFNVGLFGYVGANALIKNVKVTGAAVKSTGRYLGTVVGYSNGGTVEGIDVSGTVEGTVNTLGGVVGYTSGPVRGCTFTGTVTGGAEAGGIVGQAKDSVTDCHAVADIRHTHYYSALSYGLGGICGDVIGTSKKWGVVERCYFSGTIYDAQTLSYLGGIAGGLYSGRIEQCFNNASLTTAAGQGTGGTWRGAGGIAGYLSNGEVTDCYNAGAVNGPNGNQVAGIVGYAGGYTGSASNIHSSYSSGMVSNHTDFKHGAVLGNYFDQSILDVKDAYYDCQTSGQDTTSTGWKTTAQLTSGEPLPGFSTDVWSFTAGQYPSLKALQGTAAQALSVAPMQLQNGEDVLSVRTNFTVSASDQVIWSVLKDEKLVTTGNGISVNGSNVTLTGTYGYDHLLAINKTDNSYKYYDIYAAPTTVFDGDGTASSPFLIKNKADMETLAKAVEDSRQRFRGSYFKMTADIDLLQDHNFTGIASNGAGTRRFDGNFDGGNHTVHNFYLNSAATDGEFTGLFGVCGASSTIKNVRVAADSKLAVGRYGAAVVGYTEGSVINCRNYADVTAAGTYDAGVVGMLGIETAVIDSCYNAGNITSLAGTTGGVVGYAIGTVSRSRNDGDVTDGSAGADQVMLGGIAAASIGTIENCLNTGTLTGGDQVGGIVGLNTKLRTQTVGGGSLLSNVNTGLVSGTGANVGAIAGALTGRDVVKGNLYDGQICPTGAAASGALNGAEDMLTAQLLGGEAPEGVSADWTWTKNRYPSLKAQADEPVATAIDGIALKLDDIDNINAVSLNGALQAQGGAWTVAQGKYLAVNGNTLQVTAPADTVVTDTLAVAVGQVSKHYPLRIVPSVLAGKGSKDDPFLIRTYDDMNALAKAVNTLGLDYKGHYFKVLNDITYPEGTCTPVASGTRQFRGHFDGNGKKFTGVTLSDANAQGLGLFGILGQGAEVKDLTISSGTVKGKGLVGALAGQSAAVISNVHNAIDVVAATADYAGGLVGNALEGSSFTDCTNSGMVQTEAQRYAGGIAGGATHATFSNCENTGTILTTRGYAGGIVGKLTGTVAGCVNRGEISISKNYDYLGGIVGQYQVGSLITDCQNYGSVSDGDRYMGGIAGGTGTDRAEDASLLTGSVNYGTVTGSRYQGGIVGGISAGHRVASSVNYAAVSGTKGYVGGIVGYMNGYKDLATHLDSCYNYGDVNNSGTGSYVGGVVGYSTTRDEIANNVNEGRVTSAGPFVGGIAGNNSGTVADCYNAGVVTGATRGVGGIVGFGSATLVRCANLDSVTATGTYGRFGMAGGLVGYGEPQITDCYNLGAVTAQNCLGGLMGSLYTGFSLKSSYNAALVTATDSTSTLVANIVSGFDAGDGDVADNYYDSDVMPGTSSDAACATGLNTEALTAKQVSDGYVTATGCYPVLASFKDSALVNYYAATVVLAAGEQAANVQNAFTIGTPEGTVWTTSQNLYVDGNTVYPTALGEAWLVKTLGKRSKRYVINVTKTSGVNELTTNKPIVSRECYDLTGRRTSANASGVVIEVTRYTDGTTTSRKVVK